jgi:hypothetical protein
MLVPQEPPLKVIWSSPLSENTYVPSDKVGEAVTIVLDAEADAVVSVIDVAVTVTVTPGGTAAGAV